MATVMATVIAIAMATAMVIVMATTMGDIKMDDYSVDDYPRIRSNHVRSSYTDQSIYEWTGSYIQSVDRESRPVDLQMDQTHLSTRTACASCGRKQGSHKPLDGVSPIAFR